MGIDECRLVEFPVIHEPRGNLSFIESGRHVPFDIKRIYYLYDVPGGASRGGHAHRKLEQVVIALSGSFDLVVNDGIRSQRHQMSRSYYGLYLPSMTWREIDNFSSGSVCLVLASDFYDETDYFRRFEDFQRAVSANR